MNTIRKCLIAGAALTLAACASASQKPSVAAGSACSTLPNAQAEAAALYETGVMHAAKPVEKKEFVARAIQPTRTYGADVYVAAREGMTEQYVQRVLSCHAANGSAAHPNDPLHPTQGQLTELSVRSAGSNLAIRIVGDSPSTGQEIWQRAQALTSSGGQVSVEQVAGASSGPTSSL